MQTHVQSLQSQSSISIESKRKVSVACGKAVLLPKDLSYPRLIHSLSQSQFFFLPSPLGFRSKVGWLCCGKLHACRKSIIQHMWITSRCISYGRANVKTHQESKHKIRDGFDQRSISKQAEGEGIMSLRISFESLSFFLSVWANDTLTVLVRGRRMQMKTSRSCHP